MLDAISNDAAAVMGVSGSTEGGPKCQSHVVKLHGAVRRKLRRKGCDTPILQSSRCGRNGEWPSRRLDRRVYE